MEATPFAPVCGFRLAWWGLPHVGAPIRHIGAPERPLNRHLLWISEYWPAVSSLSGPGGRTLLTGSCRLRAGDGAADTGARSLDAVSTDKGASRQRASSRNMSICCVPHPISHTVEGQASSGCPVRAYSIAGFREPSSPAKVPQVSLVRAPLSTV
jgi:hypothetical protein